jgi:uncharacterized protein (TIGR02117 family)
MVAGMLALPLALAGAAILLGLMPVNAGWVEAQHGIRVLVNTNGVHTGIAMPLTNEIMDWRPLVPPEHLRRPGSADYIVIGYGHRAFYLDTPGWANLSFTTAANAMMGLGRTLIHVDHVQDPQENGEQRAITLSEEEYRRLVAFIRGHFTLDAQGRTIVVPGRGYGDSDAFYEAEGSYSLVLTCNEWTGRALRAAGVRMGLWTPLQQAVMWRLP